MIYRLPNTQSRTLSRFRSLCNAITLSNSQWLKFTARVAVAERVDAIHVHDLPMLGTALSVGAKLNVPVVADLHENYPAAVRYYQEALIGLRGTVQRLLSNPGRWQSFERRWTERATHVFVVVDEAKERLVAAGVAPDKITVIENTEDVSYFLGIPLQPQIVEQFEGDFVIAYIGGFGGQHRGLDTAIAAMPLISRQIPNARLLLVGKGPIKPKLEGMVERLEVRDRVTFIDWVPFEQVPSYIAASSVCIIPHQSNPHTEATSPHKLFQYMLMGKPVVVSSCRPLRRVVEDTGAGVVFEAGNSASLADAVIHLQDGAFRTQLGESGRVAATQVYTWNRTSRKLLDVYERILAC